MVRVFLPLNGIPFAFLSHMAHTRQCHMRCTIVKWLWMWHAFRSCSVRSRPKGPADLPGSPSKPGKTCSNALIYIRSIISFNAIVRDTHASDRYYLASNEIEPRTFPFSRRRPWGVVEVHRQRLAKWCAWVDFIQFFVLWRKHFPAKWRCIQAPNSASMHSRQERYIWVTIQRKNSFPPPLRTDDGLWLHWNV